MKDSLLPIIIVGLILLAGASFLFLGSNGPTSTDSEVVQNQGVLAEAPGGAKLVTFDSESFAENMGQGRNLLMFSAEWCPTCQKSKADYVENIASLPADLVIHDVDFDTATDLKEKYNVVIQDTLVQVDADGEEVKKWNTSGQGVSNILANLVPDASAAGMEDKDMMDNNGEDKDDMQKDEGENTESGEGDNTETVEENNDEAQAPSSENASGNYASFSEDALANSIANNKRTVLFFHASWCPTCKNEDRLLAENENDIAGGITVLKTDYDSQTELKKKYGVTSQHTFVILDENGEMLDKFVGGTNTLEEINSTLT